MALDTEDRHVNKAYSLMREHCPHYPLEHLLHYMVKVQGAMGTSRKPTQQSFRAQARVLGENDLGRTKEGVGGEEEGK